MPGDRQCPNCGRVLSPDAPAGLCVKCMLGIGIAQEADASAPPASAATNKPGDRIGPYKLLQQIGEGGMGIVWMAEQSEPIRRKVALKIIKAGMDSGQVLARFEAERQALALMDHPNIAKVLDAGSTNEGRPYFVMELVNGVQLTKFCDEQRLSIRERLDLFLPVCQAIQHAHQKGVIHRDIKPSNVLVALYDGRPVPKIIDFGIAKAAGLRLTERTLFTEFGALIGTPEYMSPEQAELNQLDIDTRSDIYSLGVLLYELLTGTTPLKRETLRQAAFDEVLRRIRQEEPPRPSTRLSETRDRLPTISAQRKLDPAQVVKSVRGDLDWIVMKALEKERNRRYQTAIGLAADIQRHLDDQAVLARPPGAAYQIQKAWRRNKMVFTAVAAVAAALVLGFAASLWQAGRATQEAGRAKKAEDAAEQKAHLAQTEKAKADSERENALKAQRAADRERGRADLQRTNSERNLYIANMNLVQIAWDQNNLVRVRQLLDETASFPQCGFEWYYWQRQTHLDLRTLRGHWGSVASAAFSPDGQRIVTGSGDHTAKVWEAATGKELLSLKGHGSAVWSVVFSPDGQRIVTGSGDHTARVWQAANGKELLALKGHADEVFSVAISPDGQRIVTGSGDHTAEVWEAATGKELLSLKGHGNAVWSVAISPDGQRIVTGSADHTAKVWEAASGKILLSLKGHGDSVWSVAFSPDGQRIVTGSGDKSAKVWEAASGKELLSLKMQGAWVRSVAFSMDGRRIVTGGSDNTAKVWEAASGKELLSLKGHGRVIVSAAFSPDGQWVLTGSEDDTAKLWEATRGKELLTLKGHVRAIVSAAFSPDGQRIVTGSHDQTAKIWEVASGKELISLKRHGSYVTSAAFSPDGQRIVTGSGDNKAKVWEASSGKELLTLEGHGSHVSSVAFSPDGLRIVTGSWDRTAKVWVAASGKELRTLKGHAGRVESVAFSPDGEQIVTGSGDVTAKVWVAASGKELFALKGHGGDVMSVAFSPNGQRIVTGSNDETAKVWEATSGKKLLTLKGHSSHVNSVAFSPDGQRIVTGSYDNTVKVWEAASGKELLTLKGHDSHVYPVAFSPNGQRVVTASEDQTAKVWEAATPAQVARWQAEQHPLTVDAMNDLVKAYASVGIRDEAIKLLEEALALRRKENGPEHRDTLATMQVLANACMDGRNYAEAEPLLVEFLVRARKSASTNATELESRLQDVAELRHRQKRYADAEALYRERIESRLRRPGGENSETVLGPRASLGRLYSDWAWAERATAGTVAHERAIMGEKLVRESIAVRKRDANFSAWRRADLESRLGGAMSAVAFTDPGLTATTRETKLIEAEAFLQHGQAVMEQDKSTETKYQRDSIERLIRLYEAWPKPDKLAGWKDKLAAMDEVKEKKNTPWQP